MSGFSLNTQLSRDLDVRLEGLVEVSRAVAVPEEGHVAELWVSEHAKVRKPFLVRYSPEVLEMVGGGTR